jgi:uncharacterized membrane protein YfcA
LTPELVSNPWFYAAAGVAVVLSGISKGGLGAAGGLMVPIMSLTISPVQAAAIALPILLTMDVVGVYAYRNDWDRRQIATLLPAGIIGLALGWATFRYLNDNWIRLLLGCISCGFVAYSVLRRPPAPAAPNLLKGYVCGTAAGFTTFVAHAGGPPFAIYLLPLRLATAVYVGTTVVYFTVMNALKVVPYAQLGLFDARTLWTAAVMLPVAIGGMLLGLWLRRRMSPKWFYRVAYTLLFATGTKLLFDGLSGLTG